MMLRISFDRYPIDGCTYIQIPHPISMIVHSVPPFYAMSNSTKHQSGHSTAEFVWPPSPATCGPQPEAERWGFPLAGKAWLRECVE